MIPRQRSSIRIRPWREKKLDGCARPRYKQVQAQAVEIAPFARHVAAIGLSVGKVSMLEMDSAFMSFQ